MAVRGNPVSFVVVSLLGLALAVSPAWGLDNSNGDVKAVPVLDGGWAYDEISGAWVDSNSSPYVFTLTSSAYFRITDAFVKGDHFEVRNFGTLILSTALFSGNPFNDGDATADNAWADGGYQGGQVCLGPGSYSLTVQGDGVGGVPAGLYTRLDSLVATTYGAGGGGAIYEVDFGAVTATLLFTPGAEAWYGATDGVFENTFFATPYGGSLYSVDVVNSTVTAIGPYNHEIKEIALNESNGVLYGTDYSNLYSINQCTGATTLIGSHAARLDSVWAMDYDASIDQIVGVNQTDLTTYYFNMGTGLATAVGPTGVNRITDIWYDSGTGSMFGIGNSPDRLFCLNTTTGAARVLGPIAANNILGLGDVGTLPVTIEGCCFPDGTCQDLDPVCCVNAGGVPKGPGSVCLGTQACCFPDGTCQDMDALCCVNEGGEPKGPGTVCMGMQACCFPDGSCAMMDAICCLNEGGDSKGPGSVCLGMQACCFPDGTCAMKDAICCENEGGVPKGPGTQCLGWEACCFPDGSCQDMDAICCENEGGQPKGPGSVCLGMQACCFPDGSCAMMDSICCLNEGGVPQGPGTVCTQPEACCFPDDTCAMVDPLCCDDLGGVPQGPGSVCLGMEACCDPIGVCYMADALCCLANGHSPQGAGTVCTVPEACCFPDDTCQMLDPLCCVDQGGVPQGVASTCGGMEACCDAAGVCYMADRTCCLANGDTPQGPGTVCTAPEACCFPDGTCEMLDPLCCDDLGGTPQGPGTVCTFPTACCLGNGSCVMVDPLCCDDLGGTPYLGDQCGGLEGCCIPDADTCLAACVTVDTLCCVEEFGGTPMGPGTACGTDSDADGIDDLCDICWGVDDFVFCPGCKTAIPTVSAWGLLVLALLLMTAGKIYFGRRRVATG